MGRWCSCQTWFEMSKPSLRSFPGSAFPGLQVVKNLLCEVLLLLLLLVVVVVYSRMMPPVWDRWKDPMHFTVGEGWKLLAEQDCLTWGVPGVPSGNPTWLAGTSLIWFDVFSHSKLYLPGIFPKLSLKPPFRSVISQPCLRISLDLGLGHEVRATSCQDQRFPQVGCINISGNGDQLVTNTINRGCLNRDSTEAWWSGLQVILLEQGWGSPQTLARLRMTCECRGFPTGSQVISQRCLGLRVEHETRVATRLVPALPTSYWSLNRNLLTFRAHNTKSLTPESYEVDIIYRLQQLFYLSWNPWQPIFFLFFQLFWLLLSNKPPLLCGWDINRHDTSSSVLCHHHDHHHDHQHDPYQFHHQYHFRSIFWG